MSTKTETITLSLKELKYRLPTLSVVQETNKNVNKILQININGDIVSIEAEVMAPVRKTVSKTTTEVETTVAETTATTTAAKPKTTRTRTTAKKSTTRKK